MVWGRGQTKPQFAVTAHPRTFPTHSPHSHW